jgi:integrase
MYDLTILFRKYKVILGGVFIMATRMKLPNGFGQISKIKNRRLRNPFRVMVTVGKTPEGRPICKSLKPQAYFRTYNDAYAALALYNRNPYDLETVSLATVHSLWLEEYKKGVSESRLYGMRAAWNYCSVLADRPVRFLRVGDIKLCVEQDGIPDTVRPLVKHLLDNVCAYAITCGFADNNPARAYSMPKSLAQQASVNRRSHISFTDEELAVLWQHADDPTVNIILIECYSGWRPNEFLSMKKTALDLNSGFFTGGSKTESGKNRHVPIHSKISPLVASLAEQSESEYVVSFRNSPRLGYTTYIGHFAACMKKLGLNEDHRPHDARKTFVTLCKKYKVDEYAIKRMVGHHIDDITERVYTDRSPEWLREEIEKIK